MNLELRDESLVTPAELTLRYPVNRLACRYLCHRLAVERKYQNGEDNDYWSLLALCSIHDLHRCDGACHLMPGNNGVQSAPVIRNQMHLF